MEIGDRRELVLLLVDGNDYQCIADLRHDLNREYGEYVRLFRVDWFKYVKVTLVDQTSHASQEWFLHVWRKGMAWCCASATPPAHVQ
jgi:hypothetical protein